MRTSLLMLPLLAGLVSGCGTVMGPRDGGPAGIAPLGAHSETSPPSNTLTLEQITPEPSLPPPATRPVTNDRPPIVAVALFAQAHAAILDGDRNFAVTTLERAVGVDPNSYSLWYELGRARSPGLEHNPAAIEAFLKAANIQPDHLAVQLDLARQHLAAGDRGAALHRLRLAIQTADYAGADPRSAEADYLLAQVLADLGYDRASLDRFRLLVAKLERSAYGWLSSPLAPQAAARLYVQIGDLHIRQGQPQAAVEAYRQANVIRGVNADLVVQSRLARALITVNRPAEAIEVAENAIRQTNAKPASIALLHDVYRQAGRGAPDTLDALRSLYRRHPGDRAILAALGRLLNEAGRTTDAANLLAEARLRSPADPAVIALQATLAFERGESPGALLVLIEALHRNPHLDLLLDSAWRSLVPETGRGLIKPAAAALVKVDPEWEPVRAYVAARLAVEAQHWDDARRWLNLALRNGDARSPFPPAVRLAADLTIHDPGLPSAIKQQRIEGLIARCAIDPPLQAELEQKLFAARLRKLPPSQPATSPATPAQLLFAAESDLAFGQSRDARLKLTELTRRWPTMSRAHDLLHVLLRDSGDVDAADRTLELWEQAIPDDPRPRLRRVEDLLRDNRIEAAELVLTEIDATFPANAQRLELLTTVYRESSRGDRFAPRLETLLGDRNRLGTRGLLTVALRLASFYNETGWRGDAARVLEAARPMAHGDADALLSLAVLSMQIGLNDLTSALLEEAIGVDPDHALVAAMLSEDLVARDAALSNPQTLSRAIDLARVAARAEPDRPAYRAALGWALYRAGWIAAAVDELSAALQHQDANDPVLLDRLGDALYRLGRKDEAGKAWERTRQRLAVAPVTGQASPQWISLRLTVPRKLLLLSLQQSVPVAPAANPEQRNVP